MILLYRTNTMFNMVPKRLLHGETEAQYILDTLRQKRGDKLGLTDYEVAFYDVLETNDGAMKI